MKLPAWNRSTQRGTLALGLVLVIGMVLLRNYLRSPNVIVHRAANAFLRKDVDVLLALTSSEECKAMNLTKQTVSDYLNATLYKPGEIENIKVLPTNDFGRLDYERNFWAYTTYKGQKRTDLLVITLIRTPRGEWTLNLSYTLYKFYERVHPQENDGAWHQLAAANGIKGMVFIEGIIYAGDPELKRGQSVFENP